MREIRYSRSHRRRDLCGSRAVRREDVSGVQGLPFPVSSVCGARLHGSNGSARDRTVVQAGHAAWFKLDMRLGEGSGCTMSFAVMEAACAILDRMATFEKAGIDDSYLEEIRELEKKELE